MWPKCRPIVLVVLFLGAGFTVGRMGKKEVPFELEASISRESDYFSLDPKWVKAIVLTESGGNSMAVSRKGAVGLMQLMPETAGEVAQKLGLPFNSEDLVRPEFNLKLGCYYLHSLLRRFDGDVHLTLAAYNAGPSRVKKWMGQRPDLSSTALVHACASVETRTFVERVMKRYRG